jgi:hypothetical protein
MPAGSGKPTSANLSAVLEGLMEADFILVGGFAAVVQGAPITSMDVDIVNSQSPENIAKRLAFLKSVDAFHGDGPCVFCDPARPSRCFGCY